MTGQVKLAGELGISVAEELVATLQNALQGSPQLHVDLTAVERLDTAAVQILVATKHQALQNSIAITFSCSPAVSQRLQSIGIQL